MKIQKARKCPQPNPSSFTPTGNYAHNKPTFFWGQWFSCVGHIFYAISLNSINVTVMYWQYCPTQLEMRQVETVASYIRGLLGFKPTMNDRVK